jgi:hypothetical protein
LDWREAWREGPRGCRGGERREGRREEGRFEFKNTKALYVAPVV